LWTPAPGIVSAQLLDEALDLSPDSRVPWLAALAPEDEPLKARLIALLSHATTVQASGFLGTLPKLDIGEADTTERAADE
jgi:hypothetical protein